MENNIEIIELTPLNILDYGFCGYKDFKKHKEVTNKAEWYKKYYNNGLRIKTLLINNTYQGMIEYIPSNFAHRPICANNFMVIHCVFVGFKNEYKHQGLGTKLINLVIEEAKQLNMNGVAVVVRKGPFMAKKEIFLKLGFVITDIAKPDFELLALTFNNKIECQLSKIMKAN